MSEARFMEPKTIHVTVNLDSPLGPMTHIEAFNLERLPDSSLSSEKAMSSALISG
jgi:hypothetical protein